MPKDDPDSRFKVIEGGDTPREYHKRDGNANQWVCNICEIDIGVASSGIVQIKLCPMEKGGKIVGGTKVWVCAYCLGRGKMTRVT